MRRYCGRPGCSANAAVTFTFDATERVVWLDDIVDGAARAGDLCTRHADALVPPQGWTRVDRRQPTPVAKDDVVGTASPPASTPGAPTPAADELLPHREPKRKRRRSPRWSDVPSLFDPPETPPKADVPILELVGSDPTASVEPAPAPAAALTPAPEPPRPIEPDAPIEPDTNGQVTSSAPFVAIELDDDPDIPTGSIAHLVDRSDDDSTVAAEIDEPTPAWEPRFDVDDLGGLLDAKSPLLSRAFRAAKSSEGDGDELDDDEVF